MSPTRFRVNSYSVVAKMTSNSLLKTGTMSKVQVTGMRLEPTTTQPFSQALYRLSHCGFDTCCSHLFSYNWIFANANLSD